MGEAIAAVGAAAAFAQLLHYSIAGANELYDFAGRLRSSDSTLQQWTDEVQGLLHLAQNLEAEASHLDPDTLGILKRHTDGIDSLRPCLQTFATGTTNRRLTRYRKAFKLAFREKAFDRRLSAFRHVSDSMSKHILQSSLHDLRDQIEVLTAKITMLQTDDKVKDLSQDSPEMIEIRLKTLERQNPFAIDLLGALCLLDTSRIPASLPSLIQSPSHAFGAVSVLLGNSLIKKSHTGHYLELEPIVRDLVRRNLKSLFSLSRCLECMVNAFHAQIPERLNCLETLQIASEYHTHVNSFLNTIFEGFSKNDFSDYAVVQLESLVLRTVYLLRVLGYYKQSRNMAQKALDWGSPGLFSETEALNVLLSHKARAEQRMGNYDSVVKISNLVLYAQPSPQVDVNPEAIQVVNALGLSYQSQFKLDSAIDHHLQALSMKRKLYGEGHVNTLPSLNNLAICFQSQGRHKKAEELFGSILVQRQNSLGRDDPAVFRSLNNLATSLHRQKRYFQAEKYYRASLAGKMRVFGDEHHETLRSKLNLAMILHIQKRSRKAEKILREVVAKFERNLGAGHPETLTTYQTLSRFLRDESRYREGELLIRQILPRSRESLGNSHPTTLGFILDLALLLHWQGLYAAALEYATEVRDRRIADLGMDHKDTHYSCEHVEQLKNYAQDSKESILSGLTLIEEKVQSEAIKVNCATTKAEKAALAIEFRTSSFREPTAKPWLYRHLRALVALPHVLGICVLVYGMCTSWGKS